MRSLTPIIVLGIATTFMACQSSSTKEESETVTTKKPVRLITLDPGHFHAALVQKNMFDDIDSVVHVYAPEGPDLDMHLNRIDGFNTRAENPTHWKEEVHKSESFFELMQVEQAGNVVVIAGNNKKKTEYIKGSLESGFHVLADKPMAINANGFEELKKAFDIASRDSLLLYDIITERYEITTILQREFSMSSEVFGTLEQGTPQKPAVTKESVHHFYKYVSGSILTRPPWFMDVEQQGEGIVDVTTHLVDLIQWECFPEQIIDYTKEITIDKARRWTTPMTLSQFKAITRLDTFPSYLKKDIVKDSILNVYANGEINYRIKGVHAKASVTWAFKAPEGAGDTHYSIMRGSKADLIIRQGAEQKYRPELYIVPKNPSEKSSGEQAIKKRIDELKSRYTDLRVESTKEGWHIIIPDKYKVGHEDHFSQVTAKFLEYLKNRNMPAWEVPNMIAKYYTTTKALEVAKSAKNP